MVYKSLSNDCQPIKLSAIRILFICRCKIFDTLFTIREQIKIFFLRYRNQLVELILAVVFDVKLKRQFYCYVSLEFKVIECYCC